MYAESPLAFDKYMLSSLVGLAGESRRHRLLSQLWRSISEGHLSVELDAHLSSHFIAGFSTNTDGGLEQAHEVLRRARADGVASTRVFNSFLAASLRCGAADRPAALAAALAIVTDLEAGVNGARLDPYSVALAVGLLGRARRLQDARELVERHPSCADTVTLNSLIDAAARAGNAHSALATLERMEERPWGSTARRRPRRRQPHPRPHPHQEHGPPPTETSYTSALQALVRADLAGGPMPIDRVAAAEELRAKMRAGGIEEGAATRTSLLALFSDTALAETVLSRGASRRIPASRTRRR